MKNILKRATALMLSLLMVFSVCSTSLIIYAQSEAESSDEELIYVSLGDSTTNGYGLTGYEFTQDDAFAAMVSKLNSDYPGYNGERTFENPNGLLMETPGAYPALFKNYLQIVNPSKNVNLIQLATSAMRADDVLTLMTVGTDEYFDLDDYSGNKNNAKYVIHNYSDVASELPFDWEFDLNDTMGSMGALYQKSVEAADVISINLGSNNFSIYMWGCLGPMIMGMMGSPDSDPDYVPMMDELLATVENESLRAFTKKVASDIKGILVGKLAGAVEGETLQTAVNNLADYGAYTFLSYCITYTKLLNRINDLNDKADIILIPPVNFMKGFTVDVNGKLVDMSEYITYVLQAANIYVSTMAGMKDAEFTNDIYWADHGGMVDMLMAEMVELEATNFEGAEVLHSRLISSLIGWVATLSGGAFDLNSAGTVTREAVAAYKTGDINYFMTNYGANPEAMVYYIAYVGAYVGMEKALITASQKPAVDVNLFLDIVGGTFSSKVAGVFGEVGNTVGGNAEQGGAALSADKTSEGFATLLGIGDAVAEILTRTVNAEGEKDETAQGMLYVMAYFMVADGVVCHPSEKGYQTVYATMVNAYTKGITPDAGSNGYLGEDVPAIKEIYRYLTNSGYMSDDQAVAIVDYIYDKYMDDMALSAEEKTDIAKFIYDTLITNSDLSDSAKTDIIANVYTILRNNNFLTDYEKDLAIVEELCVALDPYVTDAQAMQIVNYIYEAIQLNNVDKVAIAKYIYSVLIKDNDPEKATAIIEVVYSVLKKNGYLDANKDDLATVEAILAISALAKVSDASAVAITNYIYEQLTSETGVDVMNVVDFIYKTIFATEANELTAAEKLEVVVGVYNILTDAGKFVAYAEIFEVIEAIIEADVIAHLSAEETWGIIDTIYGLYINDKSIEGDTLAIVQIVYETVLLNDKLDEEARVNLIFTVYGVLNDAFAFGSIFDSFVKIAKELV
ncbi:MAG: hypothetical protein IKK74_00540, partial [Clostridia bacterium]|nr:hypothetical protein [Clostridia bacterium]